MSPSLHRHYYNIIYLLFIMIEIIFKYFYVYRNENVNYKNRYILYIVIFLI